MVEQSCPAALQAVLDQIVQDFNNLGWDTVILILHDDAQTPTVVAAATTDPIPSPALRTSLPEEAQPATWRQDQFRISTSYWLPASPNTADKHTVIIPLHMDQQEIGWLYLSASQMQQALGEQQITVLETLAHQAVQAIEQTRTLLQQHKRMAQHTVLSKLARTIGHHLEMADLFAAVTNQLRTVFVFDRASIILRAESRSQAQIFVDDKREDRISPAKAMSPLEIIARDRVVQGNQPYVLAANLAQQQQLSEAEQELAAQGAQSYCCLALQMWGRTFGALNLASATPDTFRQEEADFFVEIAEHIAVAVWNALLHEVEQQRRQAADALVRLAKAVNSTLDLEKVLELALEELGHAIQYDTSSILLVEDDYLRITACRGFNDPQSVVGLTFRPEEGNISHTVVSSQQIRVVEDVQVLPEWGHNREDAEGYDQIRAWIGAPLIVRGQGIGLLVLDKYEPGFYTEEDGETVMAFATQIALAIANARLYQTAEEQRDKLAAILTDTSDAVIVLDTAKRIWLINPAAERMLKVQHAQVVGQRLSALNVPEMEQVFRELSDDVGPVTREIEREGATFNANIAPVRDVGWAIAMQDITALKELDRLRTEWVAAVSHDLKNPIQVIQLGAALIEMDGPLNELQLERVLIIQRGAEQLRNLVANVLDLARLEAGPSLRPEAFQLSEVVSAAIAEVEHLAARKQLLLVSEIAPDLPPLQGDAVLLQRAFVNLLSNAIKYTPQAGKVTIRIARHEAQVTIAVIDTGEGIPAEALPQLFTRFYRVPGASAEGTGLGLSIVKSIVEKHHGEITVESKAGKGSTFTIVLPLPAPTT